jgi:beta-phosphoglucomutase-like phosphatase (HAD superfamily)
VFETVKDVMKGKGIELTPAVFARYCLCRAPRDFVGPVLKWGDKPRLSETKLVEEITERIDAQFADTGLKLDPALKKLLKAAAERTVQIGALSSLPRPAAETLAANLDLAPMKVQILALASESRCFAGAEGWSKLAKLISVPALACVAIATSAVSCRSAVAARIHCIALPNALTSFQDFGGSDYVVETLDDLKSGDVFHLLEPSW